MKKSKNVQYSGSVIQSSVINIVALKRKFNQFTEFDRLDLKGKEIAIYYELLSEENCELHGKIYGEEINALDGSAMFQSQKKSREASGYVYLKPEDVIINGFNFKRYIIKGPNVNGQKDYGDCFGFVSNYLQASDEIVCYMQYVK
jgi:hypothetical protein